jgi:hypothetical protein
MVVACPPSAEIVTGTTDHFFWGACRRKSTKPASTPPPHRPRPPHATIGLGRKAGRSSLG